MDFPGDQPRWCGKLEDIELFPFGLFPLLQSRAGGRATAAQNRFPAAISPALFLSGGQLGAREGGWPGNRGSDVYRLDRLVCRSRVCRREGAGASIRVRMKAAALSPRRPVFLSLAAGDGGAPGWIFFLPFVVGVAGAAERILYLHRVS